MKKRIALMVVLLSALVFPTYSQCLSLIQGPNGDIWGYLDGTSIYDNSSDKILDFSTAGNIGDAENNSLGIFNAETGEVFNQNSELIMILETDGDIKDSENNLIAHVDENGVMYDQDNYMLVSISGVQPLWIAYYYFYYRFY